MNFDHYFNIVQDYLTNITTRHKRNEFTVSMIFLDNHNYNLQELNKVLTFYSLNKLTGYRLDRDIQSFVDLVRKLIINNQNENIIKNYTKENAIKLFNNKILVDEDYVIFKEPFIIEIRNRIKNKTSRFKYFKEFLEVHYKNNNVRENNNLISQLFILRDCNYLSDYLDIINEKGLNYNLELFLLNDPKDILIKNPQNLDLFSFTYNKSLNVIEDIISKLVFFDVNKLLLTKVIKHHGFSLFTILLLIRCVKNYKVIPPDYKLIFDLIESFKLINKYEDYHDNYLNEYFILCFTKNHYIPDINILNECGKYNNKKLFETLLNRYKIKPNDKTFDLIIENIDPLDTYLLEKMLSMKFILTSDHINSFFKKSKFIHNLRNLLIKTNYVELNDSIFEKYIKYGNFYKDDENILNDFIIDKAKTMEYFDIIHKYNIFNNYNVYLNFLENKLNIKKKLIKHYLEFMKPRYKDISKVNEYLEKNKLEINKYCLDNCMKGGNYLTGLYLINKFKIIPDNYTTLCIKDAEMRITFQNTFF